MFSRWCRYALPALPTLSAGRTTDPDAKGHLAFAQLPTLVKTPRDALPVGDADEGDDIDSGDDLDSDDDAHLLDE